MRLKNFIMFGKGRGLRLFFWASFVFSCLASLFIYFQLTTFFEMPEVQQFIHKIPVITVENGEIVDPQKTFVQEPIPFVERGMFVLNTLDNPDYTLNFDVGVYLTKNMFYFRNHDNVITETLSNIFGTEPLIISPNMITEQITIDIFVFIAVWFILCIVLSWAIWGVVYLTSWLVLALFDRFVCPCVRARAVSAILPLLLFLCWLVSFFVAVNILTFLILAIILVIIFLWNSPTHSSIMERNLNLLQEETSAPETVVKEETKPVAAPQKKKTTVKSSTQKGKTPVKTQKTKTPVKKTTVKKAPVKTVRRVSDKKAKGKAGILKKMKSGSETFSLNPYTLTEEVWHACVHGFGILFGVAGLSLLLVFSSIYGNVWSIVSCAIFGTTIILLYTASTLYHAIPNQHTKKHLKKFDHIAIYYLIAGTYTPFLLVNMNGPLGWTLFGIVWGLAILGTCLKVLMPPNGTKLWSIGLYVLMGWLILFASHKLASSIPKVGFIFVVLGGLFYTLGIFFYIQKKRRYMHVVWHFFVLLGTMMHFFAVLFSCVFLT